MSYRQSEAVAAGNETARGCANRLAKYVTDASSIRAYVLGEFGRAPTLDAIRAMMAEHRKPLRPYGGCSQGLEPKPSDARHWQPGSLVGTLPARGVPQKVVAIKPAERLKRMTARPRVEHSGLAIGPVQRVMQRASVLFAMPIETIVGKGRLKHQVLPRQIVAYAVWTFSERKTSTPEIGRILKRDHSTILHSIHKIEKLLPDDEWLQDILAELKDAWDAQPAVKLAESAE